MSPNTDYPDEQFEDDRLKNYRVTAYVEVETSEVLLAGRASDAVEFHRLAAEWVCDELAADARGDGDG